MQQVKIEMPRAEYSEDFEKLWRWCYRKWDRDGSQIGSKKKAEEAVTKAVAYNTTTYKEICEALAKQFQAREIQRNKGTRPQYFRHLVTWINQEGWKDEVQKLQTYEPKVTPPREDSNALSIEENKRRMAELRKQIGGLV